jgi:transcriptional regulator with XRE-family HTH domain
MTNSELSSALDKLGLTRAGFAALCGVERETVYRWLRDADAKGWLPVPAYAAEIIRLLRENQALKENRTLLHKTR